jgi:hypothetical protein
MLKDIVDEQTNNRVPYTPTTINEIVIGNTLVNVRANMPCSSQVNTCTTCVGFEVFTAVTVKRAFFLYSLRELSPVTISAVQSNATCGLNSSDFTFPQFDENSDINPVFHLKQSDEFMKLKGIPKAYHLTACISIVGKRE